MPELPEVEIARENLERWLRGKRLKRVSVLDPLMLRGQSKRKVQAALKGGKVLKVERRAKYLLFDFGRSSPAVVAHLGMSGKFVYRKGNEEDPKAARVILEVSRGQRVVFIDSRRLGRFCLVDEKQRRRLARLGVEPLSKDFTRTELRLLTSGVKRPIKAFLLDQSKIAGIGNIQASEALFIAGIHPERIAGSCCTDELARLHRAIRRSLKDTLRRSRASEIDYLQNGANENPFLVYGKKGEPCPRCRGSIERLVIGGRSSYYCATCQRRKGKR